MLGKPSDLCCGAREQPPNSHSVSQSALGCWKQFSKCFSTCFPPCIETHCNIFHFYFRAPLIPSSVFCLARSLLRLRGGAGRR